MTTENKNYEQIIEDINNLEGIFSDEIIEYDIKFIETIRNISGLEDESQKIELFNLLIKKLKNEIINNLDSHSEEEIQRIILYTRKRIIESDILSEKILFENEFDLEHIKNDNQLPTPIIKFQTNEENLAIAPEQKEESQIEKIKEKISNLQKELLSTYAVSVTIDILTKKLNKTNEKIKRLEKNREKNYEKIKKLQEISATKQEAINDLEEYRDGISEENIEYIVENDEIKEIIISNTSDKIEEDINNFNEEINLLEEEIKYLEKNIDELLENSKEIDFSKYDNDSIEELTEKLNKLNNRKEQVWPDDDKNFEARNINDLFNANDIQIEINELEKIIEKRKLENQKQNNVERLTYLTKELEKREIDKENLKELENLSFIKSAYYYIYEDAKIKFEDYKKYKNLDNNVNDFINNHLRINKLNNYDNSDKLKEELKDDIIKSVKPQIIEKREENKKLLMKALTVPGFILGFGLSSVSGIGKIRMGISVAKLGISAVNIWTNKFPEGIISKIKNNVIGISTNISDNLTIKYPKLKEKADEAREFLKKPIATNTLKATNYFLNGMALGYTVGNLFELGKNIIENIQDSIEFGETPMVEDIPEIETPPAIENTPEIEVPPVIEDIPIIEEIPVVPDPIIPEVGEVFDLSSITEGFTRADSTLPVDIMESLGKEVAFDKAVELPDGRVMWHFKRLNGAGYAWFDSEVVQEVLKKSQEGISRTIR